MTANLFEELKRRKVFKVGAAYLVVAWLAVQAASIGFPAFDAPPWVLRVFILVALLGFPVTLVMAWVFESTPEGMHLDPVRQGSKRMVAIAVGLVVLALAWFFYGQASVHPGEKVVPEQAEQRHRRGRHRAAGELLGVETVALHPQRQPVALEVVLQRRELPVGAR